MKIAVKAFSVFMLSAVSLFSSSAGADISYTGGNLFENFDLLPTTNQAGFFSATVGAQSPITVSTGSFDGTKLAGTGTTATAFTADAGSGISGGIYSYGAATVAERALGSLASGSNIMGYGFRLVNNSALTVNSIEVFFTQENWRTSTATLNTVAASFSFDQSILASGYLTSGAGFTPVTSLDLVGPPFVAANGPLDGNDPLNQTGRTFTFTGLNWLPGEQFFLRWQDVNDTGSDAGLAIDSMELIFTSATIPEPSVIGLLVGLAGLGLFRRRSA